MSNSKTIDGVSRELLQNLLHCGDTASTITPYVTARIRELLDAPAVERQPKGAILRFREYVGKGQGGRDLWHDWAEWSTGTVEYAKSKLDQVKDLTHIQFEVEWLYSDTPEVAALQSTIAQLQERIKELELDKDRLDALDSNCWDVRFGSTPNGDAGDSSINIEVVGHWMDKPFERVIGENYSENLRAAIDQAMKAPAYPPERPEYPEIEDCLDATAALNGERK